MWQYHQVGGFKILMMDIKTKLIRHYDTSKDLLEAIGTIKSMRWKYPLEKQLDWIKNNLNINDYHLLIYLDEQLIGYTNLVDIEVIINTNPVKFRGIGNVCTLESGKGYGDLLMKEINKSIKEKNWNGVLLCKDNLVAYYTKYEWDIVSKEVIKSEKLKEINTMTFNYDERVDSLEYTQSLF